MSKVQSRMNPAGRLKACPTRAGVMLRPKCPKCRSGWSR